jgi:membrane protein implicated in regulation of membrane protease activity
MLSFFSAGYERVEFILGQLGFLWLFASLWLMGLELLAPGLFFFVAFACGAVCGAVAAFCGGSVIAQLWIALLGSIVSFIAIKIIFATHKSKNIDNKTNTDALIGQEAVVVEVIGVNQSGTVKVKRELWGAILKDGTILQIGTTVKVVDIQGNKLVVRSL